MWQCVWLLSLLQHEKDLVQVIFSISWSYSVSRKHPKTKQYILCTTCLYNYNKVSDSLSVAIWNIDLGLTTLGWTWANLRSFPDLKSEESSIVDASLSSSGLSSLFSLSESTNRYNLLLLSSNSFLPSLDLQLAGSKTFWLINIWHTWNRGHYWNQ